MEVIITHCYYYYWVIITVITIITALLLSLLLLRYHYSSVRRHGRIIFHGNQVFINTSWKKKILLEHFLIPITTIIFQYCNSISCQIPVIYVPQIDERSPLIFTSIFYSGLESQFSKPNLTKAVFKAFLFSFISTLCWRWWRKIMLNQHHEQILRLVWI